MAKKKYKSYSELLKDPRWQKKRLKVLERDEWKCNKCGDKSQQLHVHHKKYIHGKKPWEYTFNMLETLCAECHKDHHKKEKLYEYFKDVELENVKYVIDIHSVLQEYKVVPDDLKFMYDMIYYFNNHTKKSDCDKIDDLRHEFYKSIRNWYECKEAMPQEEIMSGIDNILEMLED